MTNIQLNHPAVKAALLAGYGQSEDTFAPEMAEAINSAIEELTADDLRDTSVGRDLKAEGWEEGTLNHHARGYIGYIITVRERILDANPYRNGYSHE